MPRGIERKVRCLGLPLQEDLLEHTVEPAVRGEDAADPVDRPEISLVEQVAARHLRETWIRLDPGSELSFGFNLPARNGIREDRVELQWSIERDTFDAQ